MADLTPQEIREQKEREYGPRGKALASRYLSHILKSTEVVVELSKYQNEEGQTVKKAFLSSLCQAIQLDDVDKSWRAIEGMQALDIAFDIEGLKSEFEEISNAFNREKEKTYKKQLLRKSEKRFK